METNFEALTVMQTKNMVEQNLIKERRCWGVVDLCIYLNGKPVRCFDVLKAK